MCTLEKIVLDSQSVTTAAIEGDEIALTLQSGQTVRTGIDRGLFVGHYSDMGAALIDAVRQGMPLTAERVHYVDEKPEEAFWIFWAEDFPAATIVEDSDVMLAQGQQVEILAQLKPIFVAMGGLEKSDDGD